MPLWGNVDNAANSDIAALIQVGSNTGSSAERTRLYGNVTAGAFMSNPNVIVGQFGVDTNEITAMQTTSHPQHAGWVLRHEGKGLRAGRVWYETLVAMGSMSGDGSDDVYVPDARISIGTQPLSNTQNTNKAVTFTVGASIAPSSKTITYKWQRNPGSGWVDVANGGVYSDNTSPTLKISNNALLTGNVYHVVLTSTGANTVTSANATLTVA